MMTALDIAGRLGLAKLPRSWRGDCPACEYARAFSVKHGRARALVYCANGCSQTDLEKALAHRFGEAWQRPEKAADPAHVEKARERKTADALRIWNGSTAVPGTAAERYLAARGLPHLATSAALRFRGDCRHPEDRALHPAMVALITGPNGAPLGVHRTFLTRDGRKANVEPVRAGKGPCWGGSVRLDREAPELAVGEGIETSASAGLLLNLPAWAALSAGNLARGLVLPSSVRAVVIAADADEPGEEAAQAAARRWQAESRDVRIARPHVPGADFNDVLRARAGVPHVA